MTYGRWLERAAHHLRNAAAGLADRGQPVDVLEVLGLARARHTVYLGLARNAHVLDAHVDASSARAQTRDAASDVVARLRAAAGQHGPADTELSATSAVGDALRRAGDALAVAADILTTHLEPGQRPRTPEGAAIRAGGGVAAGLGDVARIAMDAIGVDLALVEAVGSSDLAHTGAGKTLLEVARRTIAGSLPQMLRELVEEALGRPRLLRLLDVAAAKAEPETAIVTIADAADVLRASSAWIWQNPDEIHLAHVKAATQLGLAVSVPGDSGGRRAVWREAAAAAAELRGIRPDNDAHYTAQALLDVLRWARNADAPALADTDQLVDQLPGLANGLAAGMVHAVGRGDVFIANYQLVKPVGQLIAKAVPVWRPAQISDEHVRSVCEALDWAAKAGTNSSQRPGRSPTRVAFRLPPAQPGAVLQPTTPPPPLRGDAAAPRRAR